MARIQLRDTTVYFQDGLSGTGQVDIGNSAFAVPACSRTTLGATGVDEVQVLAQYIRAPSGGTYSLIFDDSVNDPITTAGIAWNAIDTVIETAIDVAFTAAAYPTWVNGHISVSMSGAAGLSDGTVTLTFDGASVDEKPWVLTQPNGINLTGVTVSSLSTLGFDYTSTVLVGPTNTDLVPVGARFTIATESGTPIHTVTARDNTADDAATMRVAITPAIASAVSDTDAITFLPQRLEINIGEGDMSWTEAREFLYDLDRDQLDTVRQGPDVPLELDMQFIFEYVTTESGQTITPEDALKNVGEASEWVTSSSDACEPYAIDVYVVHCVPCGTDQDEDYLFSDFRYEQLEHSIQDASVTCSGKCNVTAVTASRSSNAACS
jgi:hypothetical protein